MSTTTTNLHELKRRATRDALRQTALQRFGDRGFDDVTVAEIAAEVGVTERTFYRHFPTKEAVLFQDYQNRLEWFAAALSVRPKSESVFDAVRAAVRSFPHDIEIVRQAAMLRTSLISGDRVADHLRVVQASFAAVITEFVRDRRTGDTDIDLLASVAGTAIAAALVSAVEVWGLGGCAEDVDLIVSRALALIESGLAPLR
jgi:AcrR family transcriptional regulator